MGDRIQRYFRNINDSRRKYSKWLTTFLCLALAVTMTTSAILTLSGIALTDDRTDEVGIVQEAQEEAALAAADGSVLSDAAEGVLTGVDGEFQSDGETLTATPENETPSAEITFADQAPITVGGQVQEIQTENGADDGSADFVVSENESNDAAAADGTAGSGEIADGSQNGGASAGDDSQGVDGQNTDGQNEADQNTDGQNAINQNIDGQNTEIQNTDGQTVSAQNVDGQDAETLDPDGKTIGTDAGTTDSQNPDSQPTGEGADGMSSFSENSEEHPLPAQIFEVVFTDLTVHVETPEGAFPAGVTMTVTPIHPEDITAQIENAVASEVQQVQAVDISFYDKDGFKIEPLLPIRVVMQSTALGNVEKPEVVHISDEGTSELVSQIAPEILEEEKRLKEQEEALPLTTEEAELAEEVIADQSAKTAQAVDEGIAVQGVKKKNTLEQILSIFNGDEGTEIAGTQGPSAHATDSMPTADSVTSVPAGDSAASASPADSAASLSEPVVTADDILSVRKAAEEAEMKEPLPVAEVNFDAEHFSIYAIVGKLENNLLTTDGKTYRVSINYTEEAQIPEGSVLFVGEVFPEDYDDYTAAAAETLGTAPQSISYARFFDLTIWKDGEEVHPAAPVDVKISLLTEDALENENNAETTAQVVHFGPVSEVIVPETGVTTDAQEKERVELAFAAGGFSVYGVVYTVDFHYEINGKMYDFSIPGGGFVSLEHVVEVLGIATADENGENGAENAENGAENGNDFVGEVPGLDVSDENGTAYEAAIKLNEIEVSEATKKFVADVESVEFSSPELVWVGKVDEAATVGGLKEANGLEVEYSADLTEEQIAVIIAQTVEAGDWALISLKPFTSEERLTVTMKNGDQFVVKVTDAQISTHVITADGEDYIITVTYGPEAGIPDGAKLEAEEIPEGTEEYQHYYEEALLALNLTDASVEDSEEGFMQSVVDARFFDIFILAEGIKVEPNAPVSVAITYLGQDLSANEAVNVVHFAEAGLETITPVASAKGDDLSITFEQESFSVTGTVVNQADITNGGYYIIHQEGENWYALASDGSYVDITTNYDNASSSVVDYNGTKNISWYVSSTGDNYYIIKALNEDKYITLNSSVIGDSVGAVSIHSGTSESPKNAWITRDVTQNVYFGFNRYPTSYRYHSTALGWNNGFSVSNNDLWLQQDFLGRLHYMGGSEAYGTNLQFAKISSDSAELGGNYPNKTYNKDQLDTWLHQAMTEDPIQETSKAASVYDYDNRIYQIDLSTKSGVLAMASDISLAFVTDVSNSMLFPAALSEVESYGSQTMTKGHLDKLPHDNNEVYFAIGDGDKSSTVYAIWHNGTEWHAMDASYYAKWKRYGSSSYDSSRDFKLEERKKLHNNDDTSTKYKIYTANDGYLDSLSMNIYDMTQGNMGNRLYYLEKSIADSVSDLKGIAANYPLGAIYAALETFAGKTTSQAVKDRIDYLQIGGYTSDMEQANQTYDDNYDTLYDALSDITTADGTMQDTALSDSTFFGSPAGTGGYVGNNDAEQKYVILVTDGAPNGTTVENVVNAAKTLRANGINVITIGLSIEDVTNADKMLYWAASAIDSNGNIVTNPTTPSNLNSIPSSTADKRLFYWAKTGEDLTWIMREIVRTVMKEAVVSTTIKDEISEVFYPVSEDGVPLNDGDWIKADGTKCTSTDPARAGKITCEGRKYTVEWKDQDATWTGWTGRVFVKAREDFLGGNNITTNDNCSFTPTKYTTNKGVIGKEKSALFTQKEQENAKVEPATPCVNVDELHMTANQTDFTVYLGTEVDPATELTKLWNEIKVIEVVKKDGTESNYRIDDKGSMYYPTNSENKASKDEIYPQSGYDSIPLSHYDLDDSILTDLLADIKNSNSATSGPIPYAPYGQGKVGTITVTLTKTVNSEAQGKAPNPHDTEAVSTTSTTPVERYTLTVTYTPLPAEGDNETENRKSILITAGRVSVEDTEYKHNGSNGPGNETDESTSNNIHRIFVFAKGLMITKKDEAFNKSLSGAEFSLYRTANASDSEASKETIDGLDGKYVLVSALENLEEIYKEYGIEEGYEGIFASDYLKLLKDGSKYYLVETKAPDGYISGEPMLVDIDIINTYAPVPPGSPYSTELPSTNLYHLEQEARLTMTASNVHLATATGEDINGSGVTPDHSSDYVYFLISNNPGVVLPATGGVGTNLIYLFGVMFSGLSCAGLVMKRRRRNMA